MTRMAAGTAILFLALCAGCASQEQQTHYKMAGRLITVHTLPEGAHVYQLAPVTGERVDLGMTPLINQPVLVMTEADAHGSPGELASMFAQGGMCRLHIEKPGYQSWDGSLATDPKQSAERMIQLERLPPTTTMGAASTTSPAATTAPSGLP